VVLAMRTMTPAGRLALARVTLCRHSVLFLCSDPCDLPGDRPRRLDWPAQPLPETMSTDGMV